MRTTIWRVKAILEVNGLACCFVQHLHCHNRTLVSLAVFNEGKHPCQPEESNCVLAEAPLQNFIKMLLKAKMSEDGSVVIAFLSISSD